MSKVSDAVIPAPLEQQFYHVNKMVSQTAIRLEGEKILRNRTRLRSVLMTYKGLQKSLTELLKLQMEADKTKKDETNNTNR